MFKKRNARITKTTIDRLRAWCFIFSYPLIDLGELGGETQHPIDLADNLKVVVVCLQGLDKHHG